MSLQKIQFVDELPVEVRRKKRTVRDKWSEAARQMSSPKHFNQWAKVDTKPKETQASNLVWNLKNQDKAFQPFVIETAKRLNAQGSWDVFARITGRKPVGEEVEE